MNIFVLSTDPIIAASYHCDQHIHKMILESAQMLSAVCHLKGVWNSHLYKTTHAGHPCIKWLAQSPNHQAWLVNLCDSLESVRLDLGYNPHISMDCIKAAADLLELPSEQLKNPESFIFAGPAVIRAQKNRFPTVPLQYQEYYRHKVRQWALDKGELMRYKGRPVPDFVAEVIDRYKKAGAL